MQRTPNWKDLDLTSKCGSCTYYKPKVVDGKLVARGNCTLKRNTYKQRTESCLKYVPNK